MLCPSFVRVHSVIECFYGLTYLTLTSDFYIGDEALDKPGYAPKYPIRHGICEDWDLMVSLLSPRLEQLCNRQCFRGIFPCSW